MVIMTQALKVIPPAAWPRSVASPRSMLVPALDGAFHSTLQRCRKVATKLDAPLSTTVVDR